MSHDWDAIFYTGLAIWGVAMFTCFVMFARAVWDAPTPSYTDEEWDEKQRRDTTTLILTTAVIVACM